MIFNTEKQAIISLYEHEELKCIKVQCSTFNIWSYLFKLCKLYFKWKTHKYKTKTVHCEIIHEYINDTHTNPERCHKIFPYWKTSNFYWLTLQLELTQVSLAGESSSLLQLKALSVKQLSAHTMFLYILSSLLQIKTALNSQT